MVVTSGAPGDEAGAVDAADVVGGDPGDGGAATIHHPNRLPGVVPQHRCDRPRGDPIPTPLPLEIRLRLSRRVQKRTQVSNTANSASKVVEAIIPGGQNDVIT